MFKKSLLLSLLAFGAQAEQVENSHFNSLPIDLASPTGVFEKGLGTRYAVGIGLELESEYHGSGETQTEADPYLEYAYRAEDWEFQTNIFSNRILYRFTDDWYVSGWLNSEDGREEQDASDGSLQGMGDIDEMLEFGSGITWRATDKLTLSLIGQGYTGGDPDKGYVGFLAGHYRIYDSDQWKVDLSADVSFADSNHLTTEFGVTPEQAETSPYEAYEIGGGLKSYGIGINGVYAIKENMFISFSADFEKIASDSADSPLIQAGSDTEIEAGVTFIYKF